MPDIVPIETRKEIAEITKLFRMVLLGKNLAEIFECSPENICQAERHGHGEFKKCVASILETQAAIRCGSCTKVDGEKAIHSLVSLINRIAGFQAYRPLEHKHDIRGMFEAAKSVLTDSSRILHEIDESIDDKSELGEEISFQEKESVVRACNDAIEHLAALKDFVNENCIRE